MQPSASCSTPRTVRRLPTSAPSSRPISQPCYHQPSSASLRTCMAASRRLIQLCPSLIARRPSNGSKPNRRLHLRGSGRMSVRSDGTHCALRWLLCLLATVRARLHCPGVRQQSASGYAKPQALQVSSTGRDTFAARRCAGFQRNFQVVRDHHTAPSGRGTDAATGSSVFVRLLRLSRTPIRRLQRIDLAAQSSRIELLHG